MNIYLVKSYIRYLIRARFRKGYGIHSPFVFNLVREVIYCKYPFYAFEKIELFRKKLLRNKQLLSITDYGAGSVIFKTKQRRICDLCRKSSIQKKYGELLFRMVNHFKPDSVLELGTSIGLSTAYLALNNKQCKVFTIEACKATHLQAQENLQRMGGENVQFRLGQFGDVLSDVIGEMESLDFVFFDGHHEKHATLEYFKLCESKANNNSVFIFDDIHWSRGMSDAWKIICEYPSVTVSLDLFQLGIVFFRKECQKQHFVVKY